MKPRSGFTLAEILVASALLFVAISLFLPIFQIATRTWSRTEETQSAQRDTLALSYRLRRDFLASKPESLVVTHSGGETLLSFVSYEAPVTQETAWTSNGEVLWRKWVQYQYLDHKVRRKEVGLPTPTQTPSGPPPAWSATGAHVVASQVESFEVASPSQSVILRVRILTQQGKSISSTAVTVLPGLYGMDALGY